jgi:hypothetical protein
MFENRFLAGVYAGIPISLLCLRYLPGPRVDRPRTIAAWAARSSREEGQEMNGYLISTGDRARIVASIFEAAAARGVNVFPPHGLADGTTGLIVVGSDDEPSLKAALADVGLTGTPFEMVMTELENRPGTGAALFRRLADAGVNLRVAVPIGLSGDHVQMALGAVDVAALKRALGV